MTNHEPRQRWRLVLDRPAGETQRDAEMAWAAAIVRSGLPFVSSSGRPGAPRLVFGVPLPASVHGERELVDLLIAERLRRVEVRTRIEAVAPAGHGLRDLYDVWLGEPGLPSLVTGADYRVPLGPAGPDLPALRIAVDRLLGAERLSLVRGEGDRARDHDLRPLVDRVALDAADAILRLRLRHDAALGVARADEIVALLGELAGGPLDVKAIVREHLLVRGEAA